MKHETNLCEVNTKLPCKLSGDAASAVDGMSLSYLPIVGLGEKKQEKGEKEKVPLITVADLSTVSLINQWITDLRGSSSRERSARNEGTIAVWSDPQCCYCSQ